MLSEKTYGLLILSSYTCINPSILRENSNDVNCRLRKLPFQHKKNDDIGRAWRMFWREWDW